MQINMNMNRPHNFWERPDPNAPPVFRIPGAEALGLPPPLQSGANGLPSMPAPRLAPPAQQSQPAQIPLPPPAVPNVSLPPQLISALLGQGAAGGREAALLNALGLGSTNSAVRPGGPAIAPPSMVTPYDRVTSGLVGRF